MRRAGGFTMVELVVVMVLLGIVGAIAVPRLMGSNAYGPLALRDQIQAALRSAQKNAVARRRVICATQPNAWSPPTFMIAAASTDTGCTRNFENSIDVSVLGSSNLQTYWEDLPAQLFFQPDGSITGDFAGTSPRSGVVRFSQDGVEYRVLVNGFTGYIESEAKAYAN